MTSLFRVRVALGIALTLSLSIAYGQDHASMKNTVERDSQAAVALQHALSELGGVVTWSDIQSAREQVSCTSQSGANVTEIWTVAGKEFRYETIDGDGNTSVLVSGHGQPQHSSNDKKASLPGNYYRLLQPYQIPGLVLSRDLQDASIELRFIGITKPDSNDQLLQVDTMQTLRGLPLPATKAQWYFDPATMEPLAVTFSLPGIADSNYFSSVTYLYSTFQQKNSVEVPSLIGIRYGGSESLQQCTVKSVQLNASPASDSFTLNSENGEDQ